MACVRQAKSSPPFQPSLLTSPTYNRSCILAERFHDARARRCAGPSSQSCVTGWESLCQSFRVATLTEPHRSRKHRAPTWKYWKELVAFLWEKNRKVKSRKQHRWSVVDENNGDRRGSPTSQSERSWFQYWVDLLKNNLSVSLAKDLSFKIFFFLKKFYL